MTEDTWTALKPVLEPREEVTAALTAIGCKLVVTDRHLILVRDGRTFRPRTGVQSWPLVPTLSVRSTPTDWSPGTASSSRWTVARPASSSRPTITGPPTSLIAEVRRRSLA